MKTIADLLENYSDAALLTAEEELLDGQAPTDGAAYALLRSLNRMIDNGYVQFNDRARHIYMPTLRTLLERELARRYVLAMHLGALHVDQVTALAKRTKATRQLPGQMSLELEED